MLLNVTMNGTEETQDELNVRYADALLPLTVTFGVFATVGVVGNIFVLLVFSIGRAYRRTNYRVFVICLGIIDLLTSAFLIPAEMIKHRNYFAFGDLGICKTKCFFNVWAGNSAALCLLIICVDRFRKVVLPFKKQITPRLAVRLCIVLSFVVPVIMSVPGAIMCGVQPMNKTNIYNTTTEVNVCATEPKYEKSILRFIYKYTFIILMLGVSIACIVMYILIARQIYTHWGTVQVATRKDSCQTNNSTTSNTETINVQRLPTEEPLTGKTTRSDSESDTLTKPRPPLVHQGSRSEMKTKPKPKLSKQMSSSSFGQRSNSIFTSSARGSLFRRQSSLTGMRQFPYKTLIWFILTMVFISTYLLYVSLAASVSSFYKKSPETFSLFSFFFRLYFINNIINPIMYALLDKRFRQAVKDIIPTIKAKCSSSY